ncbi:hypothetical protein N7490_006286 [Penicillium lividum]|nr:hypothetical protein N7490_006286 [Penicillium lividum]
MLNGLAIRRSLDIAGVDASSITEGVTTVVSTAAESLQSDVTETSAAAETAVSQVSSRIETLSKNLKLQLPEYYSIGLLGYCKGEDDKPTTCSDPSTSFSFNLSGIFNSISTEVNDIFSDIDETALTGYHDAVRALILLYILAFIAAFLTTIFAIRKVVAPGGNKLLVVCCGLSTILITTAAVGVTVIYGLFTQAIKSILGPFGAQASLGVHMMTSAWLAVAFSLVVFLTWLIQACCCCI